MEMYKEPRYTVSAWRPAIWLHWSIRANLVWWRDLEEGKTFQ